MLTQSTVSAVAETTPPRRGSEPRTRDADRTRQSILDAAVVEFSTTGLSGTRVERIALRAGVNKRLIYYYFGSKEALFLGVLEQAYANIRAAETALHLIDLEPTTAVRRLVEFTWNYYLANPHFVTLLNTENMHRAAHLKQSARIREMNSPLVQLLGDVVARGQQQNLFRGGVDPVQLYITIASLCYFYLSNNSTLSTIFGRDLHAPAALSERLSHMTEVVMGYLLRK
ncbi:MAG: TetR/AcrR family transcriptional regulator [Burkholderiaceae bacterium]